MFVKSFIISSMSINFNKKINKFCFFSIIRISLTKPKTWDLKKKIHTKCTCRWTKDENLIDIIIISLSLLKVTTKNFIHIYFLFKCLTLQTLSKNVFLLVCKPFVPFNSFSWKDLSRVNETKVKVYYMNLSIESISQMFYNLYYNSNDHSLNTSTYLFYHYRVSVNPGSMQLCLWYFFRIRIYAYTHNVHKTLYISK